MENDVRCKATSRVLFSSAMTTPLRRRQRWLRHCQPPPPPPWRCSKIKGQSIDFHAFHLLPSALFSFIFFHQFPFGVCWFVHSVDSSISLSSIHFWLQFSFFAHKIHQYQSNSLFLCRSKKTRRNRKSGVSFFAVLNSTCWLHFAGCGWNHLPKS